MALLQHLEEPSAPQPKGFALFALGFRPFYLLASIFAALSVPLWALQFAGLLPRPYLSGVVWHAHEMLFGFTLAVIVGFLLTAGRNWTNLPTPTGAKLCALVAQVVGLVEMPQQGLDLPLDVRGTAFQQRVWQALRDVPAGQTVSYTEIARRIGAPKAVRAVAGACAANALAVAIPCHRVVRTDGNLSGYRWGVERKRALLEREAQA